MLHQLLATVPSEEKEEVPWTTATISSSASMMPSTAFPSPSTTAMGPPKANNKRGSGEGRYELLPSEGRLVLFHTSPSRCSYDCKSTTSQESARLLPCSTASPPSGESKGLHKIRSRFQEDQTPPQHNPQLSTMIRASGSRANKNIPRSSLAHLHLRALFPPLFTASLMLLLLCMAAACPLLPTTAATAAAAEDEAAPRKLCGRMLMSHVKQVCSEPTCRAASNNNDDLNNGGGAGAPKRSLRDLLRQCCTLGCNRAYIREYCCNSPTATETGNDGSPAPFPSISSATPVSPQSSSDHFDSSRHAAADYNRYSVHNAQQVEKSKGEDAKPESAEESRRESPLTPTTTATPLVGGDDLLDGDNAEFHSGNTAQLISHLPASLLRQESDAYEEEAEGDMASMAMPPRHRHHRHRHHRRPGKEAKSTSLATTASSPAAEQLKDIEETLNEEEAKLDKEEERRIFEMLKRRLMLRKALEKLAEI